MFPKYGTPEQLETDNGPQFNSKIFADSAAKEGFKHHWIMPFHPKAEGEAQNFMKLLNKTEQRARLERKQVDTISNSEIDLRLLLSSSTSYRNPTI